MRLPRYAELFSNEIKVDNLLLGNGFSRNFSENFSYGNLMDKCEGLKWNEEQLFEKLQTSNFEEVLKIIHNTKMVNEVYGIRYDEYDYAYENIKKSLINAVKKVHIEPSDMEGLNIRVGSKNLLGKTNRDIFTTNYDLILYWLLNEANNNHRRLGDMFRKDRGYLYFDEHNNRKFQSNLFYLHGALHLYVEDGITKKISSREQNKDLREIITQRIDHGQIPLFISEGSGSEKYEAIMQNEYLKQGYNTLREASGELTIVGHRLNEDSDQHIIDAINDSKIEKIYYGVHGERVPHDIEENLTKKVEYFNSENFLLDFAE
ncbi:DUF4917 family protein [Salicibibacter halophilus]|uniref:DUF4917 family protein n=1 Tax=Salicibibacter halophilus TaxID=2502791 RepID=UPI001359D6AE|nr:DUF4917 family protein [Salicibibacter halophilus]